MNITVFDAESTISNKGNPFDQTNKLCAVGLLKQWEDWITSDGDSSSYKIEYDNDPYGENLDIIRDWFSRTNLLVGFNAKFDLNWLYRYGIEYKSELWDCQLFEYFDSNQNWIFPDLATACEKRGINQQKLVEIEQYWDNGIDTTSIPWHIINDRVLSDVQITYKLYLKQKEIYDTWSTARQNLFRLHCADLLVLHEIERNGFYYDEEKSKIEADKTTQGLLEIKKQVYDIICDSRPNLDSNDHVSAILYGGSIKYETKVENGTFKTGAKAGQPKFKWTEETVVYPRIIKPLEHTETDKTLVLRKRLRTEGKTDSEITQELLKHGTWSVDKGILGQLLWNKTISKRAKTLIELIIKYSVEQRSLTSYSAGLPNLITKMHWTRNMLHGSINQCVVRTGRTSSSKPNLQNFDSDLKSLFTSRFMEKT